MLRELDDGGQLGWRHQRRRRDDADRTDSGSSVSTAPGACSNPTQSLAFSPMYSAFIPGSTAQTFQIPAVVRDGAAATWSSSDPTEVSLAVDSATGGVMITVVGPGTGSTKAVTIIATQSDGTCGSATLNITANTEDDWKTGSARYNDGIGLSLGPPPDFDGGPPPGPPDGGLDGGFLTSDGGSFFERDGGTACTNCHGPTATNGLFNDVAHTPEQTGGFSDQELIQIIVNGVIPDGGYFDPTVLRSSCTDAGVVLSPNMPSCGLDAYKQWGNLHRWSDITSDQQAGIVCYLRSLQPQPQTGSSNFGGLPPLDGGFP